MIRNAFTGEPKDEPKPLVQHNGDVKAEGTPPLVSQPPLAEPASPTPSAPTSAR